MFSREMIIAAIKLSFYGFIQGRSFYHLFKVDNFTIYSKEIMWWWCIFFLSKNMNVCISQMLFKQEQHDDKIYCAICLQDHLKGKKKL